MNKRQRSVRAIPIAFGAAFTAVIVMAVLFVLQMNRQAVELPPRAAPNNGRLVPTTGDSYRSGAYGLYGGGDLSPTMPGDPPPKRAGYSIAGRVVDENGEGLPNAEVRVCLELQGVPPRYPVVQKVETDGEGYFRATDLPRKRLFLIQAKDGYCPSPKTWSSCSSFGPILPLWVSCPREGDSVMGIKLVMRPGGVIAGQVVDENGSPVTHAMVLLTSVQAFSAVPVSELQVDSDGRFRTSSLVPGAYYIETRAEGFLPVSLRRGNSVYTGQENLVLWLEQGRCIEGTVTHAETGLPMPGAKVIALTEHRHPNHMGRNSGRQVNSTTVASDGWFVISIHPNEGTTLFASWQDYVSEGIKVRAEQGNTPGPITIQLTKGGSVSGTVYGEGYYLPLEGVDLIVRTITDGYVMARSDEHGFFTLKGLRPNENHIRVEMMHWRTGHRYEFPEKGFDVNVVLGEETSGIEVFMVRKEPKRDPSEIGPRTQPASTSTAS